MRYGGSLAVMLPWLLSEIEEIDDVFGGDAFPYGLAANRPTLEALIQYMVEQHFIAEAMPIEELFVPLPTIIPAARPASRRGRPRSRDQASVPSRSAAE